MIMKRVASDRKNNNKKPERKLKSTKAKERAKPEENGKSGTIRQIIRYKETEPVVSVYGWLNVKNKTILRSGSNPIHKVRMTEFGPFFDSLLPPV